MTTLDDLTAESPSECCDAKVIGGRCAKCGENA